MLKSLIDTIVKNKVKLISYIITLLISLVLLIVGHNYTYEKGVMFLGGYDDGACSATVTKIVKSNVEEVSIEGEGVIGINADYVFECEITSGENNGKTVLAHETVTAYDAVPLKPVEVGDKVLLAAEIEGEYDYFMHDYDRTSPLWILLALFVILVLLFGRWKGVNTIVSLLFTCAAVFMVFVPAIMSDKNIYLWSIITCVYIIIMTLLITNGLNKKSLAAIIGCSSGVIIAGLLTVIVSGQLNLTGVTGEDTIYLMQNFELDLHALAFSGVILGSVGAVMDVSVSISSSLKELHEQVERPTFLRLVKSGITIGRDIMGTMANTLVLAYIGSELCSTLLSVSYSSSLTTLFSREKIVEEILRALVGSIGILMTIPLTAIISSALYMGFKQTFRLHKNKVFKRTDKYFIEPPEEPSLFEKNDK